MRLLASRLLALALSLSLVAACTTSAPVDDADPLGTITTAIDQEPNLDPATTLSVRDVASLNMVFEPLLQFEAKTRRVVPAAAKALPDISSDGLTYKLQVRDDAKYSDGTSVRAQDFVYAFTRYCDPSINAGSASFAFAVVGCSEWNQLDPKTAPPDRQREARTRLTTIGVRATGERDLTIMLSHPAPYFSSILTLWFGVPVRALDVEHGGERWTEPATYIGNGPFVLSAWRHGQRLVFTPNPYYRALAKVRQWTKLIFVEPRVALEAYRHDEVDALTYGQSGGTLVDEVQADPTLRRDLLLAPTPCTSFLGFNGRRPPFDDPNVRLAFAKSIDREAFQRDVVRVGAPAISFIPPSMPGYDVDDAVQRFDPGEARRLLASSRYAGSQALRAIVKPRDLRPASRITDEWLVSQWRTNLGVEIRSDPMPGSEIGQLFRKPETTPQIWGPDGFCADYPDQHDFLTVVFHSSVKDGWRELAGFADPEFDRLVEQADLEPDHARRDDLFRRASRILSERAVFAILLTGGSVSLRKPWVRGVAEGALVYYLGGAASEQVFVMKKGT